MRVHDALGLARRARGVHDVRHVVGRERAPRRARAPRERPLAQRSARLLRRERGAGRRRRRGGDGAVPLPRRLRRPRQALARGGLPAARAQAAVPRARLPRARQPRVPLALGPLRLQGGVQGQVRPLLVLPPAASLSNATHRRDSGHGPRPRPRPRPWSAPRRTSCPGSPRRRSSIRLK